MKRLILLAACAAFFMSGCASTTESPVEPVQSIFQVGSVLQGGIPICDTEESAREVWDTHLEHGRDAAAEVWAKYARMPGERNGPVCGMSRYRVLLTAVHGYAELEFPEGTRAANLAEVMGMDRNTYWALVFRKADKPKGRQT